MAEVVEYRIKKHQEELEILVKFGIIDEKHAKDLVKERESFEYALRRRTNTKLYYLKYIKSEMKLLDSIENYRKTVLKTSLPKDLDGQILKLQAKKLGDVTRSISTHISFLFRKLTLGSQFDKRLWLAYIDFAKKMKWNTKTSAIYWRLLRVANDDEDIWIAAAEHEVEVNKSPGNAKKLYLMGLRHHPKSQKILSKLSEIADPKAIEKYVDNEK